MTAGELVIRCVEAKSRIKDYLEFCNTNQDVVGRRGDIREGEIEYVQSADEILKAEEQSGHVMALALQTRFSAFVLHPVKKPKGDGTFEYESYHQAIWRFEQEGRKGMAVLCLKDDGRILLNMQFRRPTNEYEWEAPAFSSERGEVIRDAIQRELMEECGAEVVGEIIPMGQCTAESGMAHLANLLFAVKAEQIRELGTEAKQEAIKRNRWFTLSEIAEAFRVGQFDGTKFRDGRLNALLLQASLRGIVQLPI